MPSLDVGCGFKRGVQSPAGATVSLDLNMNQAEPGFLEDLRAMDSHALCGSATHLPIRAGSMDRIYWRAVLEHIPPQECRRAIREGVRTLKQGGEAEVILPIITSHLRYCLMLMALQFPFGLWKVITILRRARRLWKIPGVPHLTDVKPWDLKPFFRRVAWVKKPYMAPWFYRPWGRFTRALVRGRFIPDIQGVYVVRCWK